MRIPAIALITLLVGLGLGLGAGKTLFKTTNTVVVTSAAPPPVTPNAPTLHIIFQDALGSEPCASDEYLPAASTVEVHAPSNGLTDGDLLGLPDTSTATYAPLTTGGCGLSVDVPDHTPARFYSIRMTIQQSRDVQSTFGAAALERRGWTARINMRTTAGG